MITKVYDTPGRYQMLQGSRPLDVKGYHPRKKPLDIYVELTQDIKALPLADRVELWLTLKHYAEFNLAGSQEEKRQSLGALLRGYLKQLWS